jgi:hypothetical protein
MEKTGVYWLAKKLRGRVLLLVIMGTGKGVGGKRYSKWNGGTCGTVMGLRFFLAMEWCFSFFDSEV